MMFAPLSHTWCGMYIKLRSQLGSWLFVDTPGTLLSMPRGLFVNVLGTRVHLRLLVWEIVCQSAGHAGPSCVGTQERKSETQERVLLGLEASSS